MVLSTIRMKIPAKKHAEVLRILKAIAEQNRVRRGCLAAGSTTTRKKKT